MWLKVILLMFGGILILQSIINYFFSKNIKKLKREIKELKENKEG